MAFEEIKAGLEKYHAEVEAKLVKKPLNAQTWFLTDCTPR